MAALLATSVPGYAVWLTFGSGVDGALTGSSIVSTTVYTDNIRNAVSEITVVTTPTGGGTYQNEITIKCANATNSSGYAVGDRILLVDMSRSNNSSRNYDIATVSAASYATGGQTIITAVSAQTTDGMNDCHAGAGSGKSMTQVIRVPQYTDVSFSSGGKLTCHAWDGSTGGILAFCCSGTLDLSSGGSNLIDANGTGEQGISAYAGGIAGVALSGANLGSGGTAGGGTGGNGTSINQLETGINIFQTWGSVSYGNAGLSITGPGGCWSASNNGGDGGCGARANDGKGPYPGRRTTAFPLSSSSSFFICVGNSGLSGKSGQGAGAGGNGGGGGGGGSAGTGGTGGTNPTGTGAGGQGGDGGHGGGFIYIKANTITGPGGSTVVITAKGANGGNAFSSSGAGGNGGSGGAGGAAGCHSGTFFAPGGGGGFGEGGNGPDGGSGGNGGDGGGIWIGYNTKTSFTSSNINNDGGSGGSPTSGGAAGTSGTQGSDGSTVDICSANGNNTCLTGACAPNPANTYGHPVPSGSGNHCIDVWKACTNCDNAFRVLTTMQNQTSWSGQRLDGTSISGIKYYNPVPGTDTRNYCVETQEGLICYEYSVPSPNTAGTCSAVGANNTAATYECILMAPGGNVPDMNPGGHTYFWTNIAGPAGSWNSTTHTATWGVPPSVIGHYSGNTLTVDADANASASIWADCPGGGGGGGGEISTEDPDRPRPGIDGTTGSGGSTGETNLPSSGEGTLGGSDPTAPEVHKIDSSSNLAVNQLHLMPNPAFDKINVSFIAAQQDNFTITVTDMIGRELYNQPYNGSIGVNNLTIDINTYPSGNYVVNVKNQFGNRQIKFEKK